MTNSQDWREIARKKLWEYYKEDLSTDQFLDFIETLLEEARKEEREKTIEKILNELHRMPVPNVTDAEKGYNECIDNLDYYLPSLIQSLNPKQE